MHGRDPPSGFHPSIHRPPRIDFCWGGFHVIIVSWSVHRLRDGGNKEQREELSPERENRSARRVFRFFFWRGKGERSSAGIHHCPSPAGERECTAFLLREGLSEAQKKDLHFHDFVCSERKCERRLPASSRALRRRKCERGLPCYYNSSALLARTSQSEVSSTRRPSERAETR